MRICVVEAPSGLGLRAKGVSLLPAALRRAGLLDGIAGVEWARRVEPAPVPDTPDPVSRVLNIEPIRDYSRRLAGVVGDQLAADCFTVVLGGDCSILIGVALALRHKGRYGLVFLDGHADFYSPAAEPTGEVASMELGVITGQPPDELADLDGLRPYLREPDVVLLGTRDLAAALAEGSPDVRQSEMKVIDLDEMRQLGRDRAAAHALQLLTSPDLDGFWIHLDADVLDDAIMPAVDYRLPGGLSGGELVDVLTPLLASPGPVGMSVTIYNPDLDDATQTCGHLLAEILNEALGRAVAVGA